MNKTIDIRGSKADDKPRTPVEDKNTLQSRAIARFVDLICEGEIEGLVNGEESIYYNNIPIRNSGGDYNFNGVTTEFKPGAPDGVSLRDYPTSESEVAVDIHVTVDGGPIIRNITNLDVDDLVLKFTIPSLFKVKKKNGDIKKTNVRWKIEIKPDGGVYVDVQELKKYGKCIAAYQTDYRIRDLERTYGSGPWEVRVTRITPDSESNSKQNDLYWAGYTQVINRVMIYPDTSLIGVTLDSQQFGSRVPSRSYLINGTRVLIPSNYDPITREYAGIWDGTFQRSYSNNPAWVWYDIVNNDRYGLGLEAEYINKWALYTIAQYCDELVPDNFGGTEPRFTFNGVLQTRTDAVHLLNMVSSSFRAMPYWGGGLASVSQDSPKDSVKIVTAANVVSGMFTYAYSALENRYTICNVSWNDPDEFYKLTVESVDDKEGLERYGYKPTDITAVGCTSRGQAYRYGRWFLYTSLYETETITYRASWDQADLLPGEVVTVMDNHEANAQAGGRIISSTANTVTLDRPVTLTIGETYSITNVDPEGTLIENVVTTAPDDSEHTVLDIATGWPGDAPQVDSVWVLSSSDLTPKQYRVITNTEVEPNVYEITAVIYDSNKYAEVEDGKIFAPAPITKVPDANTELTAPTNIQLEIYTYEDTGGTSDRADRKTGVLFSWTHTRDPRFQNYEVQYKISDGSFSDNEVIKTTDTQYDIKPIEVGSYTFRVRAIGLARESLWLTISEYAVDPVPSAPPDITGLTSIEEGVDIGAVFNGPDCEIGWDDMDLVTDTTSPIIYDSTEPTHAAPFDSELTKIKDYQVEVLTSGDVHLRYEFPIENKFKYLYALNQLDNGTAIRDVKFKVWARDIYNQLSAIPTTITVENPAPDMSGLTPTVTDIFTGLKIDWSAITPTDNDMSKYRVYLDENNPPTTRVAEVGVNTDVWVENGLTAETTYRAQVEPYDDFGVGVKSDVVSGVPLKIQSEDIDVELQSRLEVTDSYDSTSSTFAWMYDHLTDGVAPYQTYNSGDWIRVAFPTEQLVDRVSLWADLTSLHCYFSTSDDQGTTWTYYKALASHELSDGRLIEAASAGDAATNYWDASTTSAYDINQALYPNGLAMTDCRIHFLTNSIELTELIFTDQVIAEWIVANQLSAISADVGVLTAGLIQSGNLSGTEGTVIDLDSDKITLGGTVDEKITLDGTTSTIAVNTGGTIAVGDEGKLTLADDAFIRVGNNIMLDVGLNAEGNEVGQVIISDDTALLPSGKLDLTGEDYLKIDDGGMFTYYWDADSASHIEYLNVVRLESGIASNDVSTNIPGIFKEAPQITVSPNIMKSYDARYPDQNQSMRLEILDLTQYDTYKWRFRPRATLELEAGVFAGTDKMSNTESYRVGTSKPWKYMPWVSYTPSTILRESTRRISVSFDSHCYCAKTASSAGPCRWEVTMQYKVDGVWYDANTTGTIGYNSTKKGIRTPIPNTFDTARQTQDITEFRFRVTVTNAEDNKWVSPGDYGDSGVYAIINVLGYNQDLATANKLATGTLNWLAIGA